MVKTLTPLSFRPTSMLMVAVVAGVGLSGILYQGSVKERASYSTVSNRITRTIHIHTLSQSAREFVHSGHGLVLGIDSLL